MTTPIPRRTGSNRNGPSAGASFPDRLRARAAVGLLALLAAGWLWASPLPAAEESPGEKLSRLAGALRAEISAENYKRLARFAEAYKESELSAQANFALGQADQEQKRWADARARFRAAQASSWVADYATLYLARAEVELGLLEAAQQALEEFSFAGSRLEEPALVLRAELLVRLGRAREAADWLSRQPDAWNRPALLLALAKTREAAGELVAAVETLQRVYYEFPLSPEAEPSNELLGQLRGELKSQFPAPSEALRRARAEKLWAGRAFRGARSAYVDLSVRASEATRTEARLRAALALYQVNSAAAACEELSKIPQVPPALEGEFRAYRARCALRQEDYDRADANLTSLAAKFGGSEWQVEALLAAGDTALAGGDATRARQYYRWLLEALPSGEDAAEAHWKLTWLTYRTGDRAAAAKLLDEHLTRFSDSPYLSRAFFWRSRLALEDGQNSLAERLLALLREWAPRDYLTQQAERLRAHRPGAPAGNEEELPAWLTEFPLRRERPILTGLPPAARRQAEKADVLERLGFWELAEKELEAATRQLEHPALAVARARMAYEQKKFARASELLSRAFPAYWRYRLEELPREAWEMIFPRPYWEVIQREARRNEIDPYLVAALIRQESRFEPQAESSAGAVGLMQLMPGTARTLAGNQGLAESRLVEPELNIQLGTLYLAQLLRRFGGSLEKAVAGYNAGGSRIEEWASQTGGGEPAEFVESIPLTQTREFVHIVLRNYRFYRDLYRNRDSAAR